VVCLSYFFLLNPFDWRCLGCMVSFHDGLVASLRFASPIILLKRYFIDSKYVSKSRAVVIVRLKALGIILAALPCTDCNFLRILDSALFSPYALAHTEQAYSICDTAIAQQILLKL